MQTVPREFREKPERTGRHRIFTLPTLIVRMEKLDFQQQTVRISSTSGSIRILHPQTVRTRQNMLGQKLRATKVTKAIREIREILGIPDRRGNQEQTERTGSA